MNNRYTPNNMDRLPYQQVSDLLTPAEQAFYKVLQEAVAGKWQVQMKVRLADIVNVESGTEDFYAHFNPVSAKHVDFVLCPHYATTPELVIELDVSSHNRPGRQERDALVDRVLASAGLPILHVPWSRSYNADELTWRIADKIAAGTSTHPTEPLWSVGQPVVQPAVHTVVSSRDQGSTQRLYRKPAPRQGTRRYRNRGVSRRLYRALGNMLLRLAVFIVALTIIFTLLTSTDWRAPLRSMFTFPAINIPTISNPLTVNPTASTSSPKEAPLDEGGALGDVTAVVNTANLNLRAGPGRQYRELAAYRQGTSMKVLGKDPTETWVRVRMPSGVEGWMSLRFLHLYRPLTAVPPASTPPEP